MHKLPLVLSIAISAAFGLAAGGRADAAETKEPYALGWMTDAAGPAKDTYYPEAIGFDLYVKALNDRGGIGGHPINLKIEDYGLDSAKGAAAARKLVERDKVLILMGLSIEATMPSIFEVARASNTPVMTGHSARPDAYPPADPLIFTMGNVFEPQVDAMVRLSERIFEKTKLTNMSVGCYTHESPAAVTACGRRLKGFAEKTKIKPASKYVTAPLKTADFSPYAQQLIKDDPTAVWMHTIASHGVAMTKGVRALGYKGKVLWSFESMPEYLVDQAGGQVWGTSAFLSPHDLEAAAKVPEMAKLLGAAKKYGTSSSISGGTTRGWVMGIAMEKALKECGFPCDKSRLAQIMSNNFTIDTRGLTGGPITWTKNDHFGCRYLTMYEAKAKKKEITRILPEWLKFCPGDEFYPVK